MASIYDKASLVLIPSGTKTSKVYSQKPTNGDGDFTFSRSTAATRVNASGNIEKETNNYLLQSNTFNITWIGAVTRTSGQSGYDGTNDAWLIQCAANSAYLRQSISISGVYTISVYAKAGNVNWMRIGTSDNAIGSIYFDLVNGSAHGSSNLIAKNIESAGNGWWRCSATFLAVNFTGLQFYPADANNNLGEIGDNILIQDAQLEQGLVARDYIETTTTAIYGGITDNVPRLDYTDSSCPALLLEPQRTNSLKQSEYYATGGGAINSWTYVNSPVVTFNTSEVTSPEGLYNATKITGNGASGLYQTAAITGTCARSVYLRSVSGTTSVVLKDPVQTITSKTLNLTTEWTRYELVEDNTSGASSGIWIDDISSGGIYMWGAQLEEGSYATSYIPTYGSAVTRNYDLAQMLSLNNTSPAWTLFFDVDLDTCPNYNRNFLEIDTSGGSRRASFRWFNGPTANKIAPYFDVDAVYPFSTGIAENDTDNGKIVLRHDGNGNFSYFNLRNAVAQKRDYSGTPFTGSIIDIFGAADATELESILFFPTALSDEECKTLVS